jgi:hypothetical protein
MSETPLKASLKSSVVPVKRRRSPLTRQLAFEMQAEGNLGNIAGYIVEFTGNNARNVPEASSALPTALALGFGCLLRRRFSPVR